MKRNSIKCIAISLLIIMIMSVSPNVSFAENNGTITVIYGSSASSASATIYMHDFVGSGANYNDSSYQQDFQLGFTNYATECVCVKTSQNGYVFDHWLLKDENGNETTVTTEASILGVNSYGGEATIKLRTTDKFITFNGETVSTVAIKSLSCIEGNWTLEPIFVKDSSYSFELIYVEDEDEVDKNDVVSIEFKVTGADYDALDAILSYDSDLFTFVSSSNESVKATESEAGTVKLYGTCLDKDAGSVATTLTFTANAVSADKTGTFAIESAKAGTSEESIKDDAMGLKPGNTVAITVKAAAGVDITFKGGNMTVYNQAIGSDFVFYLNTYFPSKADAASWNYDFDENPYYDPEGYVYEITAGDHEVEKLSNNQFKIKNLHSDVEVVLSRTPVLPGELSSYTLKVCSATYTVAVFSGTPSGEGKVFMYDGLQMVKSGDVYLCIIGDENTVATNTRITEEDGTEIIMSAKTGDVNQTGVVDINDAQLVNDLYNGKYNTNVEFIHLFDTVDMVRFLAADVDGNHKVEELDIGTMIQSDDIDFEW